MHQGHRDRSQATLLSQVSPSATQPIAPHDNTFFNAYIIYAMRAEGRQLQVNTVVALRATDGSRITTLVRPDFSFKFYNVPDGTYYLEVDALGYQFLSVSPI